MLQGSAHALQWTYAADGSLHALAGAPDGRLALDICVLAACALVSLVSAGAACAGASHDLGQRVAVATAVASPSRRRRRLAGKSPSLSACRSQSAPPAGRASSHRAPSRVPSSPTPPPPRLVGRDLTMPDTEFSLRARARLTGERRWRSSRPGRWAPASAPRSKRDALAGGRPRGQDGHEDDDDDQCERRTSVLHSPTTDLDALRPGQERRPKTRRGMPRRVSGSSLAPAVMDRPGSIVAAEGHAGRIGGPQLHPAGATRPPIARSCDPTGYETHVCAIGHRHEAADTDRAMHNGVRRRPSSTNAITSGWRQRVAASGPKLTGMAHNSGADAAFTSDKQNDTTHQGTHTSPREEQRSGTVATVRWARKRGVKSDTEVGR